MIDFEISEFENKLTKIWNFMRGIDILKLPHFRYMGRNQSDCVLYSIRVLCDTNNKNTIETSISEFLTINNYQFLTKANQEFSSLYKWIDTSNAHKWDLNKCKILHELSSLVISLIEKGLFNQEQNNGTLLDKFHTIHMLSNMLGIPDITYPTITNYDVFSPEFDISLSHWNMIKSTINIWINRYRLNDELSYEMLSLLGKNNPVHILNISLNSIRYRHRLITSGLLSEEGLKQRYKEIINSLSQINIQPFHENPSSILEIKENIYRLYAIHGLEYVEMFQEFFKVEIRDNVPYIGLVSFEACEFILKSYIDMIDDFEKDLANNGINVDLPKGLYWYNRGILFLSIRDGEKAYNAIHQALEEDRNKNKTNGMAYEMIMALRNDLFENRLSKISKNKEKLIELTKIEKFENNPVFREYFQRLVTMTYALTMQNKLDDETIIQRSRQDQQLRILLVLTETIIKTICIEFENNNPISHVNWNSIDNVKPKSLKDNGNIRGEGRFWRSINQLDGFSDTQFYNKVEKLSHTYGLSPSDQKDKLSIIINNLPNDPGLWDSYNLLQLGRNVFLHNFIEFEEISKTELNLLLRHIWEYIISFHYYLFK